MIKSGTGKIYGTVELMDCLEIDFQTYRKSISKHRIPVKEISSLPYKKTYAWVLGNPKIHKLPIEYAHPRGAIIWVNI